MLTEPAPRIAPPHHWVSRTRPSLVLVLLGVALVLGCGTDVPTGGSSRLRGKITIDGSSTVYPLTEAVAEAFAEVAPRVNVTVGISGTGGGFKRFTKGETDVSDASRPIKAKEVQAARENGIEFVELPVAYDGLTIVVNTSNDFVDSLTVAELKLLFLDGTPVETWRDVRPQWPPVPVRIYSPGTDSGTFDYFKEVVAGSTSSIRSDMSVSEDDNVLVRGVAGDRGGIGFFGAAFYFENTDQLRSVPIVNPETGEPVLPSATTIEEGTYAPFSRPLFIYVRARSARQAHVQAFVDYYLANGRRFAERVGYVGLPEDLYERARANFDSVRTGTQFLDDDGEKVHGPLRSVYK